MIPLKYALFLKETPVYETDDDENIIYEHYEDSDGNIIYYYDDNGNKIPRDTGQKQLMYYDTVSFKCSFAMSGGETEAVTYGLSVADYEAKLSYSKGFFPFKKGDLIWKDSEVEYRYNGNEVEFDIDGEIVKTKSPDPISADYMILKLVESKNEVVAILKATNK